MQNSAIPMPGHNVPGATIPPKEGSRVLLVAPAMESLFARNTSSPWPSAILDHPVIVSQAGARKVFHEKLEELFRILPDPTVGIETAIDTGILAPQVAVEFFDLLAWFLGVDPLARRLVLYFPFELIPSRDWHPGHEHLRSSADRFVRAYMDQWRDLLEETDVRANFSDGNILEPELAPNGQPLVRKAAHLIPHLVQKGLVSISEVISLLDHADDILHASIVDTLPALVSQGSMGRATYEEIWRSHGLPMPSLDAPVKSVKEIRLDLVAVLPDEIESELQKLDMREALDHSRGMPPARVAWERRDNEDRLISAYAAEIAQMITDDRIEYRDILSLLVRPKDVLRLAVMRGAGYAVERLAYTDHAKAMRVCDEFIGVMQRKDSLRAQNICDELEGILARFANLGIITKETLAKFGFELPRLDAEFSPTGTLASEIRGFSHAIDSIADDPEYSKLFYPVAFFFGSRLKGYAKRNADLDMAVFVRPGVAEHERPEIRRILARLFPSEKIDGKIVEFWLESEGERLQVRDFPDPDVFLGDSTWIHLLFGSVWLGREDALRDLYARFLPGFLDSSSKTLMGHEARMVWLEELERDVLQYRLMHKGYRRFFPPAGGIDRFKAKGLDPESVFWDSGYRRLATKLFVSRVFLPQL
ncbi:nucleotidyltransferase domain-containing protein [Candidatus Kaiserbacteria bacterium]|nr:nucleotidyltransferase domain-containing protein [Candidatus Kaiserbacteria bacterium]